MQTPGVWPSIDDALETTLTATLISMVCDVDSMHDDMCVCVSIQLGHGGPHACVSPRSLVMRTFLCVTGSEATCGVRDRSRRRVAKMVLILYGSDTYAHVLYHGELSCCAWRYTSVRILVVGGQADSQDSGG